MPKEWIKKFIKKIPLLGGIAGFVCSRLMKAYVLWIDFTWVFRNARLYRKESLVDYNEQWRARLGQGGAYSNIQTYRDPTESSDEVRGDDEFLLSIIPEGSKILEVGCGNGRLGYLLTKRKECQWVGLDISSVPVDEAKRKGLEAYACDLNNLNDPIFDTLRDREWDYIISIWVIQLLQKAEELVQLLGDMGSVQIHGMWNAGHWSSRLRFLFGRFPIYSYSGSKEGKFIYPYAYGSYYRHWTFNDFKQWAHDLGFEAEAMGVGYKFPMKTAGLKKSMLLPSLRSGRVLWLMRKR